MHKKKYIAKISAICLMLVMLFSTTAFAASAADSTTKLQTTVPKTHTVRLEIGEHGSVTVGKETYTGTKEIQVNRLSEVSYKIKVEGKYEIETVTYDRADVTDQLHGKSYQAPPINKDGIVFQVDFALKNSEKEYPPASGSDTSWNKDQEDGLSIKVSEDLGKITEVTVDGKVLDKDDYTVSGQPPVVTLKPEFLETLKDGKHIVRIQGENGYTEVTITIEKKISQTTPTEAPDKKPGNTPQQGTTTNSGAVKTGDETPVMLLMVCALLSGGFLCVIVLRKKAASKK